MTDRHLHCVYFQYTDKNSIGGFCLLKQEKIKYGFEWHCPEMVLRPLEVLTYFLKHEGYCDEWNCALKKAKKYLDKTGFNDYPKGEKDEI